MHAAPAVPCPLPGDAVLLANCRAAKILPKDDFQDGSYLYVGNLIDQDTTILEADGDQQANTGKSLQLLGHLWPRCVA